MKKISLFMLMIFGVFMLFAQEAQKEEANNEEVKAEAATEATPETAQSVEASPETSQEPVQTAETPAEPETPAQEEQKPVETTPEGSNEESKTMEMLPETSQEKSAAEDAAKSQTTEYYRPYVGVGAPLIVIGTLSVLVFMPAMGAMAFAASDGCKDKDWEFCKQCRGDHHTAWTVGSVMTGVVGAGMLVVGSWLSSIEKPRENNIEVNSIAIMPTKKGMVASIGFKF